MIRGGPGTLFVLADRVFSSASKASDQVFDRTDQLEGAHATVNSAAIGSIDGRSAVRLRYFITVHGFSVSDTEYDILTGDNHVILVVFGQAASQPHASLLDWMASTLTVQS